jgi:hypothetical protein
MTTSAAELWVSDRAEELREEHPEIGADEAEERARRESWAGRCPYRVPEDEAQLESIEEWLARIT